MKISCCLIIRDEIRNLAACIASVRPHVDEICILDTGSTDGSAELGRKLADKWSHTTACNDAEGRIADFAAARNLNLAMASHDVVLWLDGDDLLQGGDQLRKLVSEAPAGSAWAILAEYEYDQDDQGRPVTVQWRERLVCPASGFEWRGPVHEGLLGKAGTSVTNIQTNAFRVVHCRKATGKQGEPGRNLRILRGWFEKHGEADARLMHYYGAELLGAGQLGMARYWLRRHTKVAPWSDERCLSLQHLARVEFAMGDYEEAARWALEALAAKSWPEPCWLLGMSWCALAEQGIDREHNLRRGLHWLERGMRLDGDPLTRTLLMVDPSARYEAHGWFAPALVQVGRIDDAIRSAEIGLSGKPDQPHLKNNLAEWRRYKVVQACEQLELSTDQKHVIGAALMGQVSTFRPEVKALPPRPAGDKLRIAFWLGHASGEPWTPETLMRDGGGGSETMAWEMARRLAKLGHSVSVFAHPPHPKQVKLEGLVVVETGENFEGVKWFDAGSFQGTDCDVLIVSRQAEAVTLPHTARARVLWVHDVHVGEGFTPQLASRYDAIWCLSKWHREFFLQCYPWCPPGKVEVTRNGIDLARFARTDIVRNPHRAIYSSSPDRGLVTAVKAWPKVRELVPDAELHVFYGFEGWERALAAGMNVDHPFCGRAAKVELTALCEATEGVVLHGRVSQQRLAEEMLASGVWFYPTWFDETSCITAMEAQAAGLVCVCPPQAALAETVFQGMWMQGDLVESFRRARALALSGHFESRERAKRVEYAGRFSLDTLATDWEQRLRAMVDSVVPAFSEAAE